VPGEDRGPVADGEHGGESDPEPADRTARRRVVVVLELDQYDREQIFADVDPVTYAGTVPSVHLFFDETATLDATGTEALCRHRHKASVVTHGSSGPSCHCRSQTSELLV
jgi:hypothetical protein